MGREDELGSAGLGQLILRANAGHQLRAWAARGPTMTCNPEPLERLKASRERARIGPAGHPLQFTEPRGLQRRPRMSRAQRDPKTLAANVKRPGLAGRAPCCRPRVKFSGLDRAEVTVRFRAPPCQPQKRSEEHYFVQHPKPRRQRASTRRRSHGSTGDVGPRDLI